MASNIIKGAGDVGFFDPSQVDISSFGPIVPGELIMARDEGQEIIRRAKEEAALIRQRAEQVLVRAVEEKAEERARGYEEGRQQGLAELTGKIVEVEAEREKILSSQESDLIEMVLDISRKIVARELERGAIVDIVREALNKAIGDRVVVKVHPNDRKRLEKEFPPFVDSMRTLKIQEDAGITPGGCLVETELGTVDARLETQWAAIRNALGFLEAEENS